METPLKQPRPPSFTAGWKILAVASFVLALGVAAQGIASQTVADADSAGSRALREVRELDRKVSSLGGSAPRDDPYVRKLERRVQTLELEVQSLGRRWQTVDSRVRSLDRQR